MTTIGRQKIGRVRSTCVASLPQRIHRFIRVQRNRASSSRDALIRAVRPDTTKIIPPGKYHRDDLGARLSLLSRHDASRPSGVLLFIVPALPRLASGTHLPRPEVRNFFVRSSASSARARAKNQGFRRRTFEGFRRTNALFPYTYLALSARRSVSPPVSTLPPRDYIRPLAISSTVFDLPLITDVRCRSASLVCSSNPSKLFISCIAYGNRGGALPELTTRQIVLA